MSEEDAGALLGVEPKKEANVLVAPEAEGDTEGTGAAGALEPNNGVVEVPNAGADASGAGDENENEFELDEFDPNPPNPPNFAGTDGTGGTCQEDRTLVCNRRKS